MNGEPVWDALSAIGPAELLEATLELHWAAQVVAAAGRTFAEPADDDSHTSMTWSESVGAFVGAPFAGAYPFRAALRPGDLTLLLLDRTGAPVSSFALPGRRLEEAFEWLSLGVATYFGGPPPVIERRAYEIPAHPVGDGAPFPERPAEGLAVVGGLYGRAARLIDEATDAIAGASVVRCWPHHFDIASPVTLSRDADGSEAHLPTIGIGAWHTEGWTGAVLEAGTLLALPGPERTGAVEGFLAEATRASMAALRRGDLEGE